MFIYSIMVKDFGKIWYKYYDDFISLYRGFKKKNSDEGAIQEFIDKTLNRDLYSNLVDQSLIDRAIDFITHP